MQDYEQAVKYFESIFRFAHCNDALMSKVIGYFSSMWGGGLS